MVAVLANRPKAEVAPDMDQILVFLSKTTDLDTYDGSVYFLVSGGCVIIMMVIMLLITIFHDPARLMGP